MSIHYIYNSIWQKHILLLLSSFVRPVGRSSTNKVRHKCAKTSWYTRTCLPAWVTWVNFSAPHSISCPYCFWRFPPPRRHPDADHRSTDRSRYFSRRTYIPFLSLCTIPYLTLLGRQQQSTTRTIPVPPFVPSTHTLFACSFAQAILRASRVTQPDATATLYFIFVLRPSTVPLPRSVRSICRQASVLHSLFLHLSRTLSTLTTT